jgi:Integrase core domain
VRVIRTPFLAPNCNAHAERFVRSIKEECQDRMIPLGKRHFRRALTDFVVHYHRERNHQGLGNELIDGVGVQPQNGRVRRRQRLGASSVIIIEPHSPAAQVARGHLGTLRFCPALTFRRPSTLGRFVQMPIVESATNSLSSMCHLKHCLHRTSPRSAGRIRIVLVSKRQLPCAVRVSHTGCTLNSSPRFFLQEEIS